MRIHSLFCAGLLIFAQPAAAFAQQTEATDVLKEVRLLRHAIETIIATNIRAQIVLSRLQIQEHRTERATEQLELARQRRIEIVAMIANGEDELKNQVEQEKHPQSAEHAQILASIRQSAERNLAHMQQARVRAMAEEAEAANALAQELSQAGSRQRQP